MQNISPENSLPLPRTHKKRKDFSHYGVNDYLLTKSKSVQFHTDLVSLIVKRILNWS